MIVVPFATFTPLGRVLINYPLTILTPQDRMLNSLTQIKALCLAMECHSNLIPACVVPGVNTYCCAVHCFCGREASSKGRPYHVTSPAWHREHHRRVAGWKRGAGRCHILWIPRRITPPSHHSAALCARLQPNKPSFRNQTVLPKTSRIHNVARIGQNTHKTWLSLRWFVCALCCLSLLSNA